MDRTFINRSLFSYKDFKFETNSTITLSITIEDGIYGFAITKLNLISPHGLYRFRLTYADMANIIDHFTNYSNFLSLNKIPPDVDLDEFNFHLKDQKNTILKISVSETKMSKVAVVSVIIANNTTDFGKVILPGNEFISLIIKMKNLANNGLLIEELVRSSHYQEKMLSYMNEMNLSIKTLNFKSTSENTPGMDICDIDSEEEEETVVDDFKKFMEEENSSLPDITDYQRDEGESIEFTDNILDDNFSNLPKLCTALINTPNQILAVVRILSTKIDPEYKNFFDADSLKTICLLSRVEYLKIIKGYLEENIPLRDTYRAVLYSPEEKSDVFSSIAQELIIYNAILKILYSRLKIVEGDPMENMHFTYFNFRSAFDPFSLGILRNYSDLSFNVINKKLKLMRSKNLFDDIDDLCNRKEIRKITNQEVMTVVDNIIKVIDRKSISLEEQYEDHNLIIKMNHILDLEIEQIIKEIVYLEIGKMFNVEDPSNLIITEDGNLTIPKEIKQLY